MKFVRSAAIQIFEAVSLHKLASGNIIKLYSVVKLLAQINKYIAECIVKSVQLILFNRK